jgi:hypothetical protein
MALVWSSTWKYCLTDVVHNKRAYTSIVATIVTSRADSQVLEIGTPTVMVLCSLFDSLGRHGSNVDRFSHFECCFLLESRVWITQEIR